MTDDFNRLSFIYTERTANFDRNIYKIYSLFSLGVIDAFSTTYLYLDRIASLDGNIYKRIKNSSPTR